MSLPYTVKKGDTLSAIARKHGFKTWEEIYFHPENEAFRKKRPNPNLIHPGDILNLPGLGPSPAPPSPPAPPTPPPAPEIPEGQTFVIHRMGSETTFEGRDDQFFFHLVDPKNGLRAVYWFQEGEVPMTLLQPPAKFVGTSSSFIAKAPIAINKLESRAVYFSREAADGTRSSTLVLNLSTGPVQCSMPHHLIGPGGRLSSGGPNSAGAATAASGMLRFIKIV